MPRPGVLDRVLRQGYAALRTKGKGGDFALDERSTSTGWTDSGSAWSVRDSSDLSAELKNANGLDSLFKWNIFAAVVHIVQAAVLIGLGASDHRVIEVHNRFPINRPGYSTVFQAKPAMEVLPVVMSGVFFLVSGLQHVFVVFGWKWYRRMIMDENRNWWRWIDYAISSSIMIFVIGLIAGVVELTAIIPMLGCNVAMITSGDMGGRMTKPRDKLASFYFGTFIGLVPWLNIFIQFGQSADYLKDQMPPIVYGIMISIFVLFMCFAVVEYMFITENPRLKMWGREPIVNVEIAYTILSMTAKTPLGWQTFFALR